MNLSIVSAICFCPLEAPKVLVPEIYLHEQDMAGNSKHSDGQQVAEEQEFQEI